MQEDNENEDIRSQLYERFQEALVKPASERFFDEDELIAIFDYAGDANDDYVRWEVLFCGERLYPDSDELRVRRAILYRETMPQSDVASQYVRDNAAGGESLLWKLEGVAAEKPDAADAPMVLDELLASKEVLSDEETIRIVRLASMLGCTEWLLGKQEELRMHAGYLPVLLYEMGFVLMDSGDYSEAAPFFEELTRIDPFEASYWALSCSVFARLGRSEEAREAFEFASGLEITKDPETVVQLALATDYPGMEDLRESSIEMLEAAVKESPDYFRSLSALATLYVAVGRREDAERVVTSYSSAYPLVREVVVLALDLSLECSGEVFMNVMSVSGGVAFTEEDVMRGVENLMGEERYGDARMLLRNYGLFGDMGDDMPVYYAECCYFLSDYQGVMDMFPEAETVQKLVSRHVRGPRLAHVYYRSLLALGREAEAAEFARVVAGHLREAFMESDVAQLLMLGGELGDMK